MNHNGEVIEGVRIARTKVRTVLQFDYAGRLATVHLPDPEHVFEGRDAYEQLVRKILTSVTGAVPAGADGSSGVGVVEMSSGLFVTAMWEPTTVSVFVCLDEASAQRVADACADDLSAREGAPFSRVAPVDPTPALVAPSPTQGPQEAAYTDWGMRRVFPGVGVEKLS